MASCLLPIVWSTTLPSWRCPNQSCHHCHSVPAAFWENFSVQMLRSAAAKIFIVLVLFLSLWHDTTPDRNRKGGCLWLTSMFFLVAAISAQEQKWGRVEPGTSYLFKKPITLDVPWQESTLWRFHSAPNTTTICATHVASMNLKRTLETQCLICNRFPIPATRWSSSDLEQCSRGQHPSLKPRPYPHTLPTSPKHPGLCSVTAPHLLHGPAHQMVAE